MSGKATRKVLAFYLSNPDLIVPHESFERKLKVGETLRADLKGYPRPSLCNSGFHACIDPLDTAGYGPHDGRLTLVELSGDFDGGPECDEDKICASYKKTLKIWSKRDTKGIFKKLRSDQFKIEAEFKARAKKNREQVRALEKEADLLQKKVDKITDKVRDLENEADDLESGYDPETNLGPEDLADNSKAVKAFIAACKKGLK